MNNKLLKIKDSVDLYLVDDELLSIYFFSTRKELRYKVNEVILQMIKKLDGKNSVEKIVNDIVSEYGNYDKDALYNVIKQLYDKNVLTEVCQQNILSKEDEKRFERQINYLSDYFLTYNDACQAQKKLNETRVLILGCGAIGGNIAIQLCMSGIRNMGLLDYDVVNHSDIARHLNFRIEDIGRKKIYTLCDSLTKIDRNVKIETYDIEVMPTTDLDSIIANYDFIVNTLDEPYIGYTASKVSRICVKRELPLYVAGGFDAHLASTGELIIPYETPCADCYAAHFKETLKGWKPATHPIKEDRFKEIGGITSMSIFSSSFACMEIIKHIIGIKSNHLDNTRGEFLFGNYNLSYLNVKADKNCAICGRKHEDKD